MLLMLPAFDLLSDEHFTVFIFMRFFQVLLEIVKSRPFSLMLCAVPSKALIFAAQAMAWLYTVNTFSVSLQIID
jgi:hypothetical protein